MTSSKRLSATLRVANMPVFVESEALRQAYADSPEEETERRIRLYSHRKAEKDATELAIVEAKKNIANAQTRLCEARIGLSAAIMCVHEAKQCLALLRLKKKS